MNRIYNRGFDALDLLNIMSLLLQMENLDELHDQASNDDILSELQAQDRKYLNEILDNQKTIIEKLDKVLERTEKNSYPVISKRD